MFSGIIEEVGNIRELRDSTEGRWLKIGAASVTADLEIGASVSVGGACLTVIELADQWFAVEATHETLRCTTIGRLNQGDKVNLERAMKLSDRIGGHLVSGHVDSVGRVSKIEEEGFSKLITFELAQELAPYFVEKGSVAVEGVSLTVVEPRDAGAGAAGNFSFKVALIPHTLDVTTLGELKVGSTVNVETDVVARYVARWALPYVSQILNKEGTNYPFVIGQG